MSVTASRPDLPTATAFFCLPICWSGQQPQSSPDQPAPMTPGGNGGGAPQGAGGGGGAATGGQPGFAESCQSALPMLGLFALLMYFMVVLPEKKRRKEATNMFNALKAGDTVVTIGGMHGEVVTIDAKTAVLRVGDVRMTFDRTAIARVVRDEPAGANVAKKG